MINESYSDYDNESDKPSKKFDNESGNESDNGLFANKSQN